MKGKTMAKLSARGRTTVATATKTVASKIDGRPLDLVRRLMDDGVVLHRLAKRWKIFGHLKDGVTGEQWMEVKRANGWTITEGK